MNNISKMALALAFSGLLSVAYAQDTAMSADETITNNVKTSIAQNSNFKADQITITTKDGTVYLHGMVETTAEKRDLESIAKKTTGVKKVVNETSVSKGGS